MSAGFFSVFAVVATLAADRRAASRCCRRCSSIGAVVLAFSLLAGVIGIRVPPGRRPAARVVALPLMLAVGGLALALSVAILHLALPLLLVVGIVWLIAHHAQEPAAAAADRIDGSNGADAARFFAVLLYVLRRAPT